MHPYLSLATAQAHQYDLRQAAATTRRAPDATPSRWRRLAPTFPSLAVRRHRSAAAITG